MTQNIAATNTATGLKPPYVLALDVGTSSTRALLFDSTGAVVPEVGAQCTYKLTTSRYGEVSVDADMLLGVVAETIDETLKEAGEERTKQIVAVALDTFWHSLLGVDAQNKPLTPVITWEDTRPFQAAHELRTLLNEHDVHKRTGARFHASYWPAKLRYFATEQKEVFQQVAQWISFGEYIHRRFLGRSICSLSMASGTGMLNTRKKIWDDELAHYLDVSERLPELGDAHDSVKGLTAEYATRWPALRDLPWFPAIGDGASACVGSNCATLENWSLTMGTSSAIRVVGANDDVVLPPGLWLYRIDGKRYVLGGALSEGGNLINWLDATFKLPELKEAVALIDAIEPDSHGLTILPFISGERSLGWHADARMTISGLSIHTQPADILRAGFEALAYQLKGVYNELLKTLNWNGEAPRLLCSGGALLASETLQHIVADTLTASIFPSPVHEASARGVALLALEALKIIPDVSQIPPSLKDPVKPDQEKEAVYQQAYERQRDLYQRLLG